MKIDITKLLTGYVDAININDKVEIPQEMLKNSRIKKLNDVMLEAKIHIDEDNNIILIGIIKGKMNLQDDITLEPVDYDFSTEIEEILNKSENILDITEILWQNILVEIPSKVRCTDEDIELSGNGWRVISEKKFYEERKQQENPFANLEKMLNEKEER